MCPDLHEHRSVRIQRAWWFTVETGRKELTEITVLYTDKMWPCGGGGRRLKFPVEPVGLALQTMWQKRGGTSDNVPQVQDGIRCRAKWGKEANMSFLHSNACSIDSKSMALLARAGKVDLWNRAPSAGCAKKLLCCRTALGSWHAGGGTSLLVGEGLINRESEVNLSATSMLTWSVGRIAVKCGYRRPSARKSGSANDTGTWRNYLRRPTSPK